MIKQILSKLPHIELHLSFSKFSLIPDHLVRKFDYVLAHMGFMGSRKLSCFDCLQVG
jgi:hypothetical protein